MRVVEFHRYLDYDNSLRVEFELEHGRVLKFIVQLESRFAEDAGFVAVMRYDTAQALPIVIGFIRMNQRLSPRWRHRITMKR